jgi:protein ImuA
MTSVSLRILQRRIALIERRGSPAPGWLPTGHRGIDRALGGGMMRGRVHELFAAPPEATGDPLGFAAALARLLDRPVLWLREEAAERRMGRLYAAGLAEIGLDPARLILGVMPDAAAVLRAAMDGMRCDALGGTVIELWGDQRQLNLTASRRLALSAEASGVTAILVRVGGTPGPSVAQTRWRVAAAPSIALPANAPGRPAWEVELLRQRGRPAGGVWQVEWDRERTALRDRHAQGEAALPGAVAALPADGSPGPAGLRRAG